MKTPVVAGNGTRKLTNKFANKESQSIQNV